MYADSASTLESRSASCLTKTESPIAPGTAALTSAKVDVPGNSLKHRFIAAVMALSRPSRTWPIDAGI